MTDLKGRVALVTGAARGIGRETALTLARRGAAVVAADILAYGLQELIRTAGGEGLELVSRPLDVRLADNWKAVADHVGAQYHKLDILVNNAGMQRCLSFTDTTIEDFRATMAVNVEGMFLGAKAMLELLRQAGRENPAGASIINTSSIYGQISGPWSVAYCASKGAVRMMTKALAVDLAQSKSNIRVNSIHPGPVDTEMARVGMRVFVDAGLLPNIDAVNAMVLSATPLGRMGKPNDIADVIAFLASDASRFMTGSEVTVDGGYSII
jgi:NAD(P)-dependent dehydrogenase (short-subunit alcohol dehydrogenase family)